MKEVTKMSRLAGQLEKLYRQLNDYFFNGELDPVVITIQSTPRAYGHFTPWASWSVKGEGMAEINIGAGTLDRPIENILATLTHEACHAYCHAHGIKDCSGNNNTYHNKAFRDVAQSHGLIVEHGKYGWSTTYPGDALLDFILTHDIREIEMCRNEYEYGGIRVAGGSTGDSTVTPIVTKKSSSRKYACPCCGMSVRATKDVRIACMDCNTQMIKVLRP